MTAEPSVPLPLYHDGKPHEILMCFKGPPPVFEHDDVADEYAIVRIPDTTDGVILFGLYSSWRENPEWIANVSGRGPVRVLMGMLDAGRDQHLRDWHEALSRAEKAESGRAELQARCAMLERDCEMGVEMLVAKSLEIDTLELAKARLQAERSELLTVVAACRARMNWVSPPPEDLELLKRIDAILAKEYK